MTAADEPRHARPPRDERIQPHVDNMMTLGTLALFNPPRHASEDPDPRPMTNVDLAESAALESQGLAAMRREIPDTAVFPIWSARRRIALEKGLAVPADHLWWFITSSDVVLLSDRVTHHYTRVSIVDRDNETIGFLDQWPDQFFLKEGRNTLGIRASGTVITRADFARAAVGITTWDRVSLFDAYLEAFPGQAAAAEIHCRIGYAIMTIGAELLTPQAAMYFDRARELADTAGNTALELEAAARAFLASACGRARMQAAGDAATVARMQEVLTAVLRRHEGRELLSQLRPAELGRLAFCMEQAGDFGTQEVAASRAIELDVNFEDGYWLRATARFKTGRPREALDDVNAMIALNDRTLDELDTRERATHQDDVIARQQITAQRAERRDRRRRVLEIGVYAAGQTADIHAAHGYLRQLAQLQPEHAEVRQRLEMIERLIASGEPGAIVNRS
jgi:tetratricopeptide (TPR) repeat protein